MYVYNFRWITSQDDTAPKQRGITSRILRRWITSQDDTAPKPDFETFNVMSRWITSQDDTAPKLLLLLM